MKKFFVFMLLAIMCLDLTACARTKKLMFWRKDVEESPAFSDTKNPLAVPPEYDIRPEVTTQK